MTHPAYLSEQQVLGSVLLRPGALKDILPELQVTDFERASHQAIYAAFQELHSQKADIDVIALANQLQRAGKWTKALQDYLFDLADATIISAAVPYHINVIKENRVKDQLSRIADDMVTGLREHKPPADVLARTRSVLSTVEANTDGAQSMRETLARTYKQLEEVSRQDKPLVGITSGLADLDKLIGGWRDGELIMVAGRPGMGKSILAKDFAEAAGRTTAISYFTLEMSVTEIQLREIAAKAVIPLEDLRGGFIRGDYWSGIVRSCEELVDLPIWWHDLGYANINDILGRIAKDKSQHDIGLVVIDYLQLIRASSRSESREQEVAAISQGLKAAAREHKIPIICLSQLNRKCEQRDNKIPLLSDLRASGSLEQDADIVIFLYRECMYKSSADENAALIKVAKGRNVRTGGVQVYFDGKHQIFRDKIDAEPPPD